MAFVLVGGVDRVPDRRRAHSVRSLISWNEPVTDGPPLASLAGINRVFEANALRSAFSGLTNPK